MTAGYSSKRLGFELVVSDPAHLRSLRELLSRVPGAEVTQIPGEPGQGELGVWDVLQVVGASSGVLAVAIKTLPEFIRSRRSDITVTATSGDKTITLTATNVEEAMPAFDKWFRDA